MKHKGKLLWAIIAVALIGVFDSGYLSWGHYTGHELSCSLTGGCGEVTASEYAYLFGIPVAYLGLLFYFTVLIATLLYQDTGKKILAKGIPALTLVGFIMSMRFVYLQIFVIEAICQYCMVSAATSTVLFVLGVLLYRSQSAKG